MPVPRHIAIEARRCLARYRRPPRPDAPCRGATEPTVAADAAPAEGSRGIAGKQLSSHSHAAFRSQPISSISPAPPHVAIEARRFRWLPNLRRPCPPPRPYYAPCRLATKPASRCGEATVADATPGGGSRTIAELPDGTSGANGGWNAHRFLVPSFPSRRSRPGARSRRVPPPFFPSRSFPYGNNNGRCSDSDEESQGEEQDLFAHESEKSVYQECLQSMGREHGEQDLPEGFMSVSLYKHQRMALDWMLFRENSSHCAGGILADEQGLGKTIVVIALILKEIKQQSKVMSAGSDRAASPVDKRELKDKPVKTRLSALFPARRNADVMPCVVGRTPSSPSMPAGGTLVVCPSSILMQWNEEIHKVAKGFGLSVFIYRECSRTIDPEELARHDIVLTSYGMVRPKKKGTVKKSSDSNGLNSRAIARVRWSRVVLDEAHIIRNRRYLVSKACSEPEAEKRWCITGTPMQNQIDDLYSYLRFLRYEPYHKYSSFRLLLKVHNSIDASLGKNKLEIFLGTVLLQHTKETLIDGEPIVKLPPKTIQVRKIDFTPVEQKFYLTLHKRCQRRWMAYDATTKFRRKLEGMDSEGILSLLKNLQQIKATINILNSIIDKCALTENDSTVEARSSESCPEKALVFSQFTQMLDLLEPSLNSNHIQFRRLDGKMTLQARDKAVKDFNTNLEVRVLLVSLMAGNVGLNLVSASHVIIVDPWWNPFVEDQAIGRAHRIRQTRPVTVYRLSVQDTIEERVLDLQDEKRKMVKRAFSGAKLALSEEGLRYLFDV